MPTSRQYDSSRCATAVPSATSRGSSVSPRSDSSPSSTACAPSDSAAASSAPNAAVADSLVSPACVVHGTVRGSVLGPGVVVEPGASVLDSVVLADTVVRCGATVTRAILDERIEVGADARIGHPDGTITVTGRGTAVAAETELDAEDDQ